jgi:hypothetical protein
VILYARIGKFETAGAVMALARHHGYSHGLTHRDAAYNRAVATKRVDGADEVLVWHHDCRDAGSDQIATCEHRTIGSWASAYPTEYLLPNGQVFTPDPFELVFVNNNQVMHRVPPAYVANPSTDREFVRVMLDGELTPKLVQRWRTGAAEVL